MFDMAWQPSDTHHLQGSVYKFSATGKSAALTLSVDGLTVTTGSTGTQTAGGISQRPCTKF